MLAGPITIHLIRHGEVHNPEQILYGRRPGFRLSNLGQQQAADTGRHLLKHPLNAIFSSPMLRARQTAREIIQYHSHLKVGISSLLNEVCTSYEGQPGTEIDARDGDVYTGTDACSEQPRDILARTQKFILRMRRHYTGGRIAAVTHGDIITFMVLWAKAFDQTPQNKTRLLHTGFPVAYPGHASITTLTYGTSLQDEKPDIRYISP